MLAGSRGRAAPPHRQGAPEALTRWLRSYSAIFSISSFIFSMFCLRRSSHSLLGGVGNKDTRRQKEPLNPSVCHLLRL